MMIEEIPDDQEWMNQTRNPLDDDKWIIKESNTYAIPYVDDDLTISFINRYLSEEAQETWINMKITTSQAFAQKYDEQEEEQTLEQWISPEYHKYTDIFNEKIAD